MENQKYSNIKGEDIYQIVKDLCNIGFRRAGTAPAHKAERYIYEKMKDVGLEDVKMEEINFTRWWSEKHELTILSEKTPGVSKDQNIEVFPSWYSGSTPPEGISGEVAYVGLGTRNDFKKVDVKNKIALIDGEMIFNFMSTHGERMFSTVATAEKKGALAVICINGSPSDAISYTNLFSHYKRPTSEGIQSHSLPVFSINDHDGEYLKHLCTENYEKLTLKLVEIAKTGPANSNTIIGTLPGKSDDIILIGCHTDSTFTGAIDNASGNAGLITLAKHYANKPLEQREKTMMFVGWTGHECDSIGSRLFGEMHEEMLSKVVTFLELDGFGSNGYYNGADGGIVSTRTDERRGIFITDNSVLTSIVFDAVLKYKLLPAVYVSAIALPVGDFTVFMDRGVPSILMIGKPPLYHTKLDTVDTIRPEQLERSAKAHIEIINKIHVTDKEEIKNSNGKKFALDEFITKKKGIEKPSVSFYVLPEVLTVRGLAFFVPGVISNPESILLTYEWDLGDGTTGNSLFMVHTYKNPGSYNVRLKVTDNFGNIAIQERVIRVVEKYRKK